MPPNAPTATPSRDRTPRNGVALARLTARIVEWSPGKGHGFISFERHRIFLHLRDFTVNHKQPEVGDVVEFVLGRDHKGRLCAQKVEHRNQGGRIRFWHLLTLLPLLVAPGYALWQAGGRSDWRLVFGCSAGLSLVTYLLYWLDNSWTRQGAWRISESTLHLAALLGGWPGAFLAQRHFRYKSAKLRFHLLFWMIITLHQFLAVDFLRGWSTVRAADAAFVRATMTAPK